MAGAAVLISVLTVVSRMAGFGRTLVLTNAVPGCVGGVYSAANTIPNIVFEIVAGGALASLRRTAALGFHLDQACDLEALALEPRPPLIDPLVALAHLPQRRLSEAEWPSWRCGRRLIDDTGVAADQPVVILDPDGALAGLARGDGAGQLQPRLVLDPAG